MIGNTNHDKNYEINPLKGCPLSFINLAVNKLVTDLMQNIFLK